MKNIYETLIERAAELGAEQAILIDTDKIVFDPRSYMKCRFGCNRWGRFWTCPPHLDISPEMFMHAFSKYNKAILIRTTGPRMGQEVAVAIEKEAMVTFGLRFSFAMALCVQCEECSYPDPCRFPHLARPSMDAYGVDVEKTLEPLKLKVDFDKDGKLLPVWYSLVLLD
ncbi:MAG: DUF2284 domain-containing protein [Desulfobacteraceae bacterium]|nr:DUF2284 domain-containing protein [Desulfobacteraceae bacterium]